MKLKNFHLIFLTIIVALTVTSSPLNETTKTAETTETTETDVLEVDPADLWSYTPDQLIQFSKKVLQKEIDAINVILSVPDEECNFDNIIAPIARHLENDVYKYSYTVNLMTYVHPDENMVNAAYTCVGILFSGIEPYFYTQELYGKVKKVFENIENGKYAVPKDPEDLRLLEDVRNEFIAYGIEYSPEVAEKLVALNNKIGALTQEFQRCLIK
eukprot:jgi/Orpsp1_1/1189524/evm.model.d7180000072613.1